MSRASSRCCAPPRASDATVGGARLGPRAAVPGSAGILELAHRGLVPASLDADALRAAILERYDLSLGNGLGKLAGRVFRIGHLGDFNDLMLAGTLAGIEMGLNRPDFAASGVAAALDHLAAGPRADQSRRAQPDLRPGIGRAAAATLLDVLAAHRGLVCAVGAGGDHAPSAGRGPSGRGHGPDRADLHRRYGAAARMAWPAGDRDGG